MNINSKSVFTHVASIYANLLEQKNRLHKKRVQLPEDWLGTPTCRRFTVLGHQYGRRDVICKHSMIPESCAKFTIARFVDSFSISSGLLFYSRTDPPCFPVILLT